jgi:hypothetical protein
MQATRNIGGFVKKCPYCTAELAEEAQKCMYCGEWVERGQASLAPQPAEMKLTVQPPTRGPTKACPFCAAQIPENAWTCMYCKRSVLGGRPLAIGLALVAVVIAAVFFFGFWLPGWLDVKKKQEEFDREFQKHQQEFDRKWNEFPGR